MEMTSGDWTVSLQFADHFNNFQCLWGLGGERIAKVSEEKTLDASFKRFLEVQEGEISFFFQSNEISFHLVT